MDILCKHCYYFFQGDFSLKISSENPLKCHELPTDYRWTGVRIDGEWTRESAGGAHGLKSWTRNPVYRLEVVKPVRGSLVVVLSKELPRPKVK